MPGFEHSCLTDIQRIRNDLRDRYKEGYPIIKELLQNADDAEASCLHFGWFPGFPDIAHPLLKGPAFFVVNDGEFKPEDQRGIRQFGISAKASNQSTIGKFGLGLKSVFHLCEAFFYCWSEQDAFKILNPWHGEASPYHEDWELDETSSIASGARQAIVGRLESARVLNCPNWFCLWIPLRQEQHCGEVPAIVEEYPGNERKRQESILGLNPAHEVSKTLPMLRHLKSVSTWNVGTDGRSEMLFQVNLDEGAARCRYRSSENGSSTTGHGHQLPLQGVVNMTEQPCRYAGFEQMLDRPILRQLPQSEYWPTVIGIDPDSGAEQQDREKANPHSAAYFVETPAEHNGAMRIQRAVFLPIGTPAEDIPCQGESDFTLMLHGYFFPNAGRTDIEIPEDEISDAVNNETDVRLKWNYELFVRGTLPLVIPALNRFANEDTISEEKVFKLTRALEKSNTFDQYREFICGDTQWVQRLRAQVTAWEQLDSPNEEILEIPLPPSSAPDRPDRVFPNLREIARQHVITFHSDPRLTAQKAATKWSPELLTQLLPDSPVEAVFGSRGMLRYLVDFLKDCEQNARCDVSDVLQRLVTEAFDTVPLGQLRSNRSEIKNYLALLGSNLCFPIPENLSEEVCRKLFELRLLVLLVPQDLLPDEPHRQLAESLCNEDTVQILKCISTLGDNSEFANPERTLVKQVIEAGHWDEIRTQCNSLKIFTAYNCRTRTNVSISLNQLTELQCNGMLFAYPISQAMHLQQALQSESIFLIENETRTMLGWSDIAPCDERACLQVLESTPALNGPEERVGLLDALLPQVKNGPAHNQMVRYLIHVHPSDENLPLFMDASAGQELWSRIASQILRLKNEQWRVIPNALGETVPPQHWAPLGIHALNAAAITQLICEVGSERVSCTGFSADERQQILQHINDPEVLRGLQIYDDVDGNLVRINPECTYWESDFAYEGIPRENITILRSMPESLMWRQSLLLDRFFTTEAALHALLGTENPHQHWTLILNAVDHLNSVPSELKRKLRAAQWLPVGVGRSPQDVIYVKDMEDEVTRIVAQFGDLFVDVSMLPEKFRAHPGYKRTVRDIFPKRDDALEMLGEMMAESEKYRIGEIDTLDLDLKVFLATFAHAPPQLMPSHSVLQTVCETFDEDVCREHLLPELCQRLPISNTVDILNFLAERHEAAGRNRKSRILDIFNRYLITAVNKPDFMEILRQVRLLSREGNWKSPAKLCLDSEGIHPDDLLDEKQSEVLIGRVQASENRGRMQSHELLPLQGNEQQQFNESAARLEQYFDAWHGVVQDEVVGGFLALLGNHPRLFRLSAQYLGNHSVEGFRSQLDRNWEIQHASSAVGANENIHQTMTQQRFLVEVFEGPTIQLKNLMGELFNASVEQEGFDSLFIGSTSGGLRYESNMNYRVTTIQLRSVQPDQLQRPELLDLIKHSAGLLLNKVYRQTLQNLDEVFDELAESEQLDVEIAQDLLLDVAFSYVGQLELRQRDSDLAIILHKWDEARRRKTEAQHNGDACAEKEATEEQQQEREELKSLLQGDVASQDAMLVAVRRKIGEYQYKHKSIAFEIFQNADDAAVERFEMHGNSIRDNTDSTRFVIQQEDDKIAFIHWGRPINKFRSAHFDGRPRGFDRDLEKMLILSHSDKSQSPETVTGKFGLGFKSVFLTTSKPRVASGQLGFEAVGGFFPKQLTGEALRELQCQIEACQNDGKEGTIISIQAEECSVQECLKEFRDVVHFIPVFARRIRRCDWIRDGQTEFWEWNDRLLTQSKRVCVGEFQPSSDGQRARQTAMVFRASQGDLLVGLDAHGVVKLEESIPTVWVTVPIPTTKCLDLGFIVNGRFDLDVGRAQLAPDSQNNRAVADSIGRELGESLIELYDEAGRNWDEFCENLNLVRDANRYQFWHSLWRLFSKVTPERSTNDGDASQLIRRILWNSSNHGMAKLLYHRYTVPSGLWGEYKTLTKLDELKFKTVGVLDTIGEYQTEPECFCQASQWHQFKERISPGQVVSHARIASVLTSLLPDENLNMQEVTLCSLLKWELGESRCVEASQASQLGSLITRNFLNELNRGDRDQRKEYNELTAFLCDVRFQACDGEFHAAEDLLIKDEGADNRDEPLRAAFAPDDRLLNDDYTGNALECFKACRSELNAPSQLLAIWALQASGDQTRCAVLQYILDGESGRQMASIMWSSIQGTWLSELRESPLLTHHFKSWERSKILVELRLFDERTIIPPIPDPVPLITLEPSAVLENIHAWWTREAADHIGKYEESVYGDFCLQLSNQPDWNDSQIRENWLTLFMLGALHTMGRVKPEQHRSFIRLWRQNGWLQIVANPQKNLQSWVGIVVDFLDQSGETIQFYHWMCQFVSIVQFAYWLEDYGDAFLAIDQLNGSLLMTDITRLRYSSQFQGSDLDAPSIDRTLGIGACFVVRELVRLGILSSEHVHRHCYTPIGRVRKLLESIGCPGLDSEASQRWEQSVAIYEFLSEYLEECATFNGAFDIPFLIIAEDGDLQNEFFGRHISPNEDDEETYE